MEWQFLVLALFGFAPFGLLVFGPACAVLARRRNRDVETWFLLGAVGGPIALAWVMLLPGLSRSHQSEALNARRHRTPAERIPGGVAIPGKRCLLCHRPLAAGHACRPEEVEDRIQRRWTVRVGGQRIIGPL
ncbi:MAG: hypothetical protein OEW24_08560 [Chloroflexota bacterium]|nr:hypothetical protein [Chloroflexota bacterium]